MPLWALLPSLLGAASEFLPRSLEPLLKGDGDPLVGEPPRAFLGLDLFVKPAAVSAGKTYLDQLRVLVVPEASTTLISHLCSSKLTETISLVICPSNCTLSM